MPHTNCVPPLTVNRSLLELAVYRSPATPELKQLGQTLLEINARHERLLDGLLVLARAQRDIAVAVAVAVP